MTIIDRLINALRRVTIHALDRDKDYDSTAEAEATLAACDDCPLLMSPKQLIDFAAKQPSTVLSTLADEYAQLAASAGYIARYLESRGGAGYGDRGHETALKAANKARRTVRKAMGFNTTHDIRV